MVAILDGLGQPTGELFRRAAIVQFNPEGEAVELLTMFLKSSTFQLQHEVLVTALNFINAQLGFQAFRMSAEVGKLYSKAQAVEVMKHEAAIRAEEGKKGD